MDLQTRKIKFVQEFLGLEDEKLISRFERLIRAEGMRVRDLHRRIDLSMTDSENGKLTGADDLLDEIKRW
ncbi:MAG TPA: hypothetical protein GXX42_01360 [Petrimonas sp.]|uniref:hypothetical protein n=1 Tax=Petrimonas sp. TaxID=2023866 RepID=UPI00095CFC63|nr:hypothetical protein [Petrimonas sp.]OJV38504.1 MAG: hypothetical protein BGO33_06840 [Bacteroidia bacterium 43-41]HHV84452.1 hypothetical protein [Petrimonas sp.]